MTPDVAITEAMSRQAAAERERRSTVLEAEGRKKASVLDSEGDLVAVENAAKAQRLQLILEAEGEAEAIRAKATAQAQAIADIAKALALEGGDEAAKINIARNYIDMYASIGEKSNTMIFNDKPGDVNALLAQASAVISAAGAAESKSLPR